MPIFSHSAMPQPLAGLYQQVLQGWTNHLYALAKELYNLQEKDCKRYFDGRCKIQKGGNKEGNTW
jgi:hypothetical protein